MDAIDGHLHIWSDANAPPSHLVAPGQPGNLVAEMDANGVRGALIVQPGNHKYDHEFVAQAIAERPGRFKAMLLMAPMADQDYLVSLQQRGFCGVRFNPYLWPEGEPMSAERGLRLFKQCGALSLPVGFMCFKGLNKHFADLSALLDAAPSVPVIIDHWGFFVQDGAVVEESWDQLLSLAGRPQVHVKISAMFRNAVRAEPPYKELKPRLAALVAAFGAERVLTGSDYPFALDFGGYGAFLESVRGWGLLSDEELHWVTRGTAERLFGAWEGA